MRPILRDLVWLVHSNNWTVCCRQRLQSTHGYSRLHLRKDENGLGFVVVFLKKYYLFKFFSYNKTDKVRKYEVSCNGQDCQKSKGFGGAYQEMMFVWALKTQGSTPSQERKLQSNRKSYLTHIRNNEIVITGPFLSKSPFMFLLAKITNLWNKKDEGKENMKDWFEEYCSKILYL